MLGGSYPLCSLTLPLCSLNSHLSTYHPRCVRVSTNHIPEIRKSQLYPALHVWGDPMLPGPIPASWQWLMPSLSVSECTRVCLCACTCVHMSVGLPGLAQCLDLHVSLSAALITHLPTVRVDTRTSQLPLKRIEKQPEWGARTSHRDCQDKAEPSRHFHVPKLFY